MRPRQIILTSLSLGVAGMAVSAGTLVSRGALADSATPATGTATIVHLQSDGQAVSCTFDDMPLPPLPRLSVRGEAGRVVPALPLPGLTRSSIELRQADPGSAPAGPENPEGSGARRAVPAVPAGSIEITGPDGSQRVFASAVLLPAPEIDGEAATAVPLPPGVGSVTPRPGTAAECAAFRQELSSPPTSSDFTVGVWGATAVDGQATAVPATPDVPSATPGSPVATPGSPVATATGPAA